MPGLVFDRMSRVREIENREPMQQEVAVVDGGISSHVYYHFARLEPPVRMRQFAGCDRAVVDNIVIGTGSLDALSSKGERSCRSEDRPAAMKAHPRRSRDIVKSSRLCGQVVGSMTCLDVVVVWSPIQSEMARSRRLFGVRVIADVIRPQHIVAVVNLDGSVQLVEVAGLFLIYRAEDRSVFQLGCCPAVARSGRTVAACFFRRILRHGKRRNGGRSEE